MPSNGRISVSHKSHSPALITDSRLIAPGAVHFVRGKGRAVEHHAVPRLIRQRDRAVLDGDLSDGGAEIVEVQPEDVSTIEQLGVAPARSWRSQARRAATRRD